jgi:mono/diheme cytochrome c family protein
MQPPVAGTVRIDAADWVVASVEKDYDPKFGNEMENPFTSSDVAAMARGEVMFDTYCSPCHGATGLGDGAVTKRGYPEPLSLIDGEAAYMSDLDLYRVIQFGGSDMPSYAVQMPPSDRWKAILFLRQLQADVGGQ